MPSSNLTLKNISDALLANPITRWGLDSYLSIVSDDLKGKMQSEQISEFLNEVSGGYALPCFLDDNYLNQIDVLEDDSDDNSTSCFFRSYKTREEYAKIEGEYRRFGNYFLRNNSWFERRLFTITGPAGCGKTTLANKLILDKTEKLVVRNYDFETKAPIECTMFINKVIPESIRYKPSAILSFMLLVIKEIGLMLHEEFNGNFSISSADTFISSLKDICIVYNQFFSNSKNTVIESKDKFDGFFTLLTNFIDCLSDDPQVRIQDSEKLVISMQHFFNRILKNTFCPDDASIDIEKNELENTQKLLFILFILYFCLSRIGENEGTHYLLFIDNIEYAILEMDTRIKAYILNSDVSMIFKSILLATQSSSKYITDMLEKIGMPKVSPASGVLLTMRDTTDGFFQEIKKSIHIEDKEYANIDIASYFDAVTILKKKMKYFFDVNIEDCNNIEDTVEAALIAYYNILSDRSKSKWCLNGFIHEFYNHHHRNIVKNIMELILSKPEEIRVFNEQWKIILSANKEERKTKAYTEYKHMNRQFVIRLLLGYVNTERDHKGIFEQLKEQPHFYTRRILTYLHNVSLYGYDYISTNHLIEKVLLKPSVINIASYNNIILPDVEKLAQALYIMNRTKPDETLWTNLLYIEVPGGHIYGKPDLINTVTKNWSEYLEYRKTGRKLPKSFEQITVKITDAGRLYVWFMAEFEYFSCRYAKDFPALFMASSKNELEKVIGAVSSATLQDDLINGKIPCITGHLQNEPPFLAKIDGNGYSSPGWIYREYPSSFGQVHPKRILLRHKAYLEIFLRCINSRYVVIEKEEKDKMKEYIMQVINQYTARLNELERNYPDYMKLC